MLLFLLSCCSWPCLRGSDTWVEESRGNQPTANISFCPAILCTACVNTAQTGFQTSKSETPKAAQQQCDCQKCRSLTEYMLGLQLSGDRSPRAWWGTRVNISARVAAGSRSLLYLCFSFDCYQGLEQMLRIKINCRISLLTQLLWFLGRPLSARIRLQS